MQAAILAIRTKFSGINHLQTDLLAKMLEQEGADRVTLFDCREEKEYNVSHLKGATRLNPGITPDEARNLALQPGTKDVICYCSIGYRSSLVAQLLKAEHPTLSVYNLEGSIFKWANERRPLVDSQGHPTVYVHPYDAVWGLLVDKELRKY